MFGSSFISVLVSASLVKGGRLWMREPSFPRLVVGERGLVPESDILT